LHELASKYPEYATEALIKHPNVSPETLTFLNDSPSVQPHYKNVINDQLSFHSPDSIYSTKVNVRHGTNRLRKIRDLIMNRGVKEAHPKDLPPGDWSVGRAPNGLIHADKIQQWIDAQPPQIWNVSFDRWTGAQRHNDQNSAVFQLNMTNDQIKKLKDSGAWNTFRKFHKATMSSGHPVKPSTIGWVRFTSNRPEAYLGGSAITGRFKQDYEMWLSKVHGHYEHGVPPDSKFYNWRDAIWAKVDAPEFPKDQAATYNKLNNEFFDAVGRRNFDEKVDPRRFVKWVQENIHPDFAKHLQYPPRALEDRYNLARWGTSLADVYHGREWGENDEPGLERYNTILNKINTLPEEQRGKVETMKNSFNEFLKGNVHYNPMPFVNWIRENAIPNFAEGFHMPPHTEAYQKKLKSWVYKLQEHWNSPIPGSGDFDARWGTAIDRRLDELSPEERKEATKNLQTFFEFKNSNSHLGIKNPMPFINWMRENVHPKFAEGFHEPPKEDTDEVTTPELADGTGHEVFIDEIQSDFGQAFSKQLAASARQQAEQEATQMGLEGPEKEAHVQQWMQKAKENEKELPDTDHQKISHILFGGKKANEVLGEAFLQHLRDKGLHNADIQIHSSKSKAPISLGRPTDDVPAHFKVTYEELPQKRFGFEPSTYGTLEHQDNSKWKGNPTWQGKVRKTEDFKNDLREFKKSLMLRLDHLDVKADIDDDWADSEEVEIDSDEIMRHAIR
jgi:hypothetical protein